MALHLIHCMMERHQLHQRAVRADGNGQQVHWPACNSNSQACMRLDGSLQHLQIFALMLQPLRYSMYAAATLNN